MTYRIMQLLVIRKLTKRKRKRKGEAPNYNISVEDEIPDYEFEGLFD